MVKKEKFTTLLKSELWIARTLSQLACSGCEIWVHCKSSQFRKFCPEFDIFSLLVLTSNFFLAWLLDTHTTHNQHIVSLPYPPNGPPPIWVRILLSVVLSEWNQTFDFRVRARGQMTTCLIPSNLWKPASSLGSFGGGTASKRKCTDSRTNECRRKGTSGAFGVH